MEVILVTGGAGFIGSNLIAQLEKKYKIVVVDNFSTGKKENLVGYPSIELIEEDICDTKKMEKLFEKYQFNYIFHLAAVASVQESFENTVKTHQVNMEATLNILELTRKKQKNLKKIIFSSTSAVYGDEKKEPKTESTPIRPFLSPYAIDKYTSELYFEHYSKEYQIPYTILRFFNVYGSGQNSDSPYSGVISILMKYLLGNSNNPFIIYGDGEQTRDFIYIDNVVEILQFVMNSDRTSNEIFNVSTNTGTSLNELIASYQIISGQEIKTISKPMRMGDIKSSVGNNKKLIQVGFKEKNVSIYEGLRKYIELESRKAGERL